MPTEIRLSEIGGRGDEFRVAVENHIARMTEFNKEVGKPRPTAPLVIEKAIKRIQEKDMADVYVADYTLIDDLPPPTAPLTLEDRKILLHAKLLSAETIAKNGIMPPRKMRLISFNYEAATAKKEEDRTTEDNENIAYFLEINKKWAVVGFAAAQAESDIEDLTEDSIDSWQTPELG